MRFPHEISCFCCIFSLWDFLMRVHAFCFIMGLWDFVFLSRYEISLWDFMLICHCDSRRFSRGFGLVEWCNRGFFRPVFLRVDCECNRPSFLATVFESASAFNGDLSQWDVTKVTTMYASKLIRILENALTGRELMLYCFEGSVGGWRMREMECTPMAHCKNLCCFCLTVIISWDVLIMFHAFRPLWDFMLFCRYFPCEIVCFLVNDFRTRYRNEISCFFAPLRALRMRYHMLFWSLCDALMRFHALWLPNSLLDGVM